MADAFRDAWDGMKDNPADALNRRGGVMMGREGFPEEEEIDDLAPQIDMGGDACCIDAKNKWEEAVIEGFPDDWQGTNGGEYFQSILDKYRNMSCEEFKEHLESRLGDISMGSLEGQLAMAAHKIIEGWDRCTQQSMGLGTDEAIDMHRSDRHSYTPFDNAWSLMKAWQFEGVSGDSSDDIMPLIGDVMDEYDSWRNNPYSKKNPEGARKPELRVPSRGISGGNRKKPLRQMMLEGEGGANILQQRVPGLRDRSLGGLPQILNWWGGKQQLGPYFRQMFKPYRESHTPYEAFGGSLSMLNALNSPRGIATDINPDPINVGRMAQIGLNIPSFGPLDKNGIPQNTKEALQDITDRANDLRYRRDMLGDDLNLTEQMELAELFASANSRAFQGHMNYKNTPEWDKGFGIMKPGLRKVTGGRGEPSIPMDFRAMAPLMRDWDLRTDRMQDVSREMNDREDIFSYYDPPYARRTFSYGDKSTADEEDELQHDTLHAAINSPGPVVYSNYMTDPDTREVLHGITDTLSDEDFDIHPWPRNIKTSKGGGKNVVEMIATRDIDWPGMGRKNRWDRFSWKTFLDENPTLKDFMGDN